MNILYGISIILLAISIILLAWRLRKTRENLSNMLTTCSLLVEVVQNDHYQILTILDKIKEPEKDEQDTDT